MTPQNYLSFAGGKSFLKLMFFHSLYEVSVEFGGDKKLSEGEIYHG